MSEISLDILHGNIFHVGISIDIFSKENIFHVRSINDICHRKYFPCHKYYYTVIRFVSISAKFDICTVVGLNGRIVEAKMRTF